jgi:hypothetical protein
MKKLVFLPIWCLLSCLLALSAKANNVSVTLGLGNQGKFVPWDKFDFVKFTGKIKTYDLSDFLKVIKKNNLANSLAFCVIEDSSSSIIPVDSLFSANSQFMSSLSTKEVEKVRQLLWESAVFDSPKIYGSKIEWEETGFRWGRYLDSRIEISAKSPYYTKIVVPGKYEVGRASIIGICVVYVLLFIAIAIIVSIMQSLEQIKTHLGVGQKNVVETAKK